MSRHDHVLGDRQARRLIAAMYPTRLEQAASWISHRLDVWVIRNQTRRVDSGRTLWKKGQ